MTGNPGPRPTVAVETTLSSSLTMAGRGRAVRSMTARRRGE